MIDFYAATQGWSAQQTRAQLLSPICDGAIAGLAEPRQDSIMCYEIPASLTIDGRPIRGGADISADDAAFAAACYPAGFSPLPASTAAPTRALPKRG